MLTRLGRRRACGDHGPRNASRSRSRRPALRNPRKETSMNMQWQTPAAIDWRFGFEISLYVANR
jgi:coenzyme PQQ precursor peptide PqqA